MSRESISGVNIYYAQGAIRNLFHNIPFLTEEDLEIIEFLGKKGFHDDKRVVLIDKKSKLNNLLTEKK